MTTRNKTIGIVGGGLLGMTLALRLAQAGFQTTILEASDKIGGLASPFKIGNFVWDKFYHVMLLSDWNLFTLLEELNLENQIHWGETKTGFIVDGQLYSMSNTAEFLTFPPLCLLSKIRLGMTIFYASKIRSWQRLESVKATTWLRRLSGDTTFNRIWLPLLKSKLGEAYDLVSASFIWAIIDRMYAARRSGLKKEMFGYVHGGYASVLDRFESLLLEHGVRIMCKTPVVKLTVSDGRVAINADEGRNFEFDAAVLTTPCSKISGFCPQISQTIKRRFQSVRYQGIVCVALLLRKPLADYYITNITDNGIPFTAVIEMTTLVDKNVFGGNSLVYLPRYLNQEDPCWEKTDEEIHDTFLAALESLYPKFRREDVLRFTVNRASHVLPLVTLNYSSELLPATKTSLENIYLVNSAQIPNGTMNLNEIIGLANRKATEIIRQLGT